MRGFMKALYKIGAMMHPCLRPLLNATLAEVTLCHFPKVLDPSCHAIIVRSRRPRTPYAWRMRHNPSRHTVP